MKSSLLICATCLLVATTGCSGQLRFPSLSSALSSLTGFGSSSAASASSGSAGAGGQPASQSSSPYSGLVRDYGRNLMMAMSNIYPTLFKPPQSQQQQAAPQSQQAQSPFDQAFASSQFAQSLYPSASAPSSGPSFSFGGSTFSISPSLPTFGSLSGSSASPSGSHQHQQHQQQQVGASPFAASFGSSINSPTSFGPLSSAPFLQSSGGAGNSPSAAVQVPSFAPASSYSAAFEAANGGPANQFGQMSMGALGPHQTGSGQLLGQSSQPQPMQSAGAYPFASSVHQLDQSSGLMGASFPQQHQGHLQQASHQMAAYGQQQQQPSQQQQHQAAPQAGQFQASSAAAAAQYQRPDVMSMAGSAPVPSASSYSTYGSIPSAPSQQAPASPSSYQQPSYR